LDPALTAAAIERAAASGHTLEDAIWAALLCSLLVDPVQREAVLRDLVGLPVGEFPSGDSPFVESPPPLPRPSIAGRDAPNDEFESAPSAPPTLFESAPSAPPSLFGSDQDAAAPLFGSDHDAAGPSAIAFRVAPAQRRPRWVPVTVVLTVLAVLGVTTYSVVGLLRHDRPAATPASATTAPGCGLNDPRSGSVVVPTAQDRPAEYRLPEQRGADPVPLVVEFTDGASATTAPTWTADPDTSLRANMRWGPPADGAWNLQPGSDGHDDVSSALSLIETLAQRACVDPDRTTLIGTGRGALLAAALACRDPELFDTLVMVGQLPTSGECPAGTRLKILAVATDGTPPPDQRVVESWAKATGCGSTPDAVSTGLSKLPNCTAGSVTLAGVPLRGNDLVALILSIQRPNGA
jgi:pimeloyl-ACP methyl ester carboxylesterase